MLWSRRSGTLTLMSGGIALIGLMAYVLNLRPDGAGSTGPRFLAEEIAVFLPDASDWKDFRLGLEACRNRGLATGWQERPGEVLVRTPAHARPIRFSWRNVAGVEATRDEVARLLVQSHPPAAFIGSSNTLLTSALADALRREVLLNRIRPPSPVLLIPWATSVAVDQPLSQPEPVHLLELYPDRTFRFCPNNRALADLVTECVIDRSAGAHPARAVMLVDRPDPYSRDLALGFTQALKRLAPDVDLRVREDDFSNPTGHAGEDPGPTERARARALADLVRQTSPTTPRPLWVLLPLQANPTRRMIGAIVEQELLVEAAREGRLEIICGDGIGADTLDSLASSGLPLPVWCVSSGSGPTSNTPKLPAGVLISAEIAAALLLAFDHERLTPDESDLRKAILAFDLSSGSPFTIGRSLQFLDSGERMGPDLGVVLSIEPGRSQVLAFDRARDGKWSGPVPSTRSGAFQP